jgi:hypothetical protein
MENMFSPTYKQRGFSGPFTKPFILALSPFCTFFNPYSFILLSHLS